MAGHLRRSARTPARMSASLAMMRAAGAVRDLLSAAGDPGAFGTRIAELDFAPDRAPGRDRARAMLGVGMRCVRPLLVAALLAALSGVAAVRPLAQALGQEETATYFNSRYGFTLSYPTAHFRPQEPLSEDGRVWVSHDGNARLLAGALPNADGMKLQDYRKFVMEQSYPGASIDYAPVRETWFVLSGTRDGTTFYERVTFTCGGRLINSWAMLYPEGERRIYDRIVERVARSYRAGTRNCG
jgi:hypothetical protein